MFGLVRDGDAMVYREWAPAAKAVHLIGENPSEEPSCWFDSVL